MILIVIPHCGREEAKSSASSSVSKTLYNGLNLGISLYLLYLDLTASKGAAIILTTAM